MFAVFGLSGIASGFFAGLFGIGGGLIMVPALVYAFNSTGIPPDHVVTMALGTSMPRSFSLPRTALTVIIAKEVRRSRRSAVRFPGLSPEF